MTSRIALALCTLALAAGCSKKPDAGTASGAPAADQPAADKPAADKPAADKPAADKPAADKPAADKPPADKPAAAATGWCGAAPCPCEPDTETKHHGTEIMSGCKLTTATEIQGYPVKPGSEGGDVAFRKDGSLQRFYLDKDFEVKGFMGKAKTGIELFPDGTLQSVNLKEPREIDGLPCQHGVTFFQGGKLRRCGVSKEVELSGRKVQPDDIVTLDKDGKLHRWELGSRVEKIGKYECSGYFNYVHPTGELLRCGFAKPVKVEGKSYKAGDLVCFDVAGKVADCTTFSFDVGGG